MRCPTHADLPPPPPGKTGWPWTTKPPRLPALQPDGTPWPRISIVTPSYNQGQYIEETLRGVLLQGYPNLEYIVMDGGSTDGTVDILRKYAPWLAHWTSEPDRGQAHAINKGMASATGAIGAYLNSDDYYLPGALLYVAGSFRRLWLGPAHRPLPAALQAALALAAAVVVARRDAPPSRSIPDWSRPVRDCRS